MRRALLALAALFALLGWSVDLQAQAPATRPPAGDLVLRGITFPENLAGFDRGDTRSFEQQSPGLGQSVAYHRTQPRLTATAFVYDKGLQLVPADAERLAAAERDEATHDVEAAGRQGLYQRTERLEAGQMPGPDGGPPQAFASFRLVREGAPQDSYLFVTVRRGNFVKVRVTGPSDPGTREAATAFAAEVARLAGR